MTYEIVLYVKARYEGRIRVGDGEIIAVVEDGVKRTPRSKSFEAALKHIQYETDLEPAGQPELLDGKGKTYRTHKYTYHKRGCFVRSRYVRWAVAYPVGEWPDRHWMVRRKGNPTETRYESEQAAKQAVREHCNIDPDYLMRLRRDGMVGKRAGVRRSALTREELAAQATKDKADLFG